MKNVVLRSLAYGYAKSANAVTELIAKARMKVTLADVELALLELAAERQVEEPSPGRWRRA